MTPLENFCKERRLNVEILKKQYGDLILETGGQLFIDEEKFEAELPLRGKRIARKRIIRGKIKPKSSQRIWQTNNHGLLRALIPRKQKQVTRIAAEIQKLEGTVEQTNDPNKKAVQTIKLRSKKEEHEQAQTDLGKMEARLQELASAAATDK